MNPSYSCSHNNVYYFDTAWRQPDIWLKNLSQFTDFLCFYAECNEELGGYYISKNENINHYSFNLNDAIHYSFYLSLCGGVDIVKNRLQDEKEILRRNFLKRIIRDYDKNTISMSNIVNIQFKAT